MPSEIIDLLDKINELRQELEDLVVKKGTLDPEVLAASQVLNVVLAECYKIMMEKEQ